MKCIVVFAGLGMVVVSAMTTIGCSSQGAGPPAGTGGNTGVTMGTGGSTGATGGSSGTVDVTTLPTCLAATDPNTQIRGNPCTPNNAASPDCMVRCGVDKLGYRPLQCLSGVWTQGLCYFPPAADYSCYKLSSSTPACAPGTSTATGSNACTVPTCKPCGDGVNTANGYTDSSGAPKAGFCVCTAAGVWSCGSNKEYPCYPASPGAVLPASCN
jgi:hypothetical protein